jgi:hypothetical protein
MGHAVPADAGGRLRGDRWTPLLQQILSEYVAITVDEGTLDRLEGMWDEVVRRGLGAFIQVNELSPALRRYPRAERRCVS